MNADDKIVELQKEVQSGMSGWKYLAVPPGPLHESDRRLALRILDATAQAVAAPPEHQWAHSGICDALGTASGRITPSYSWHSSSINERGNRIYLWLDEAVALFMPPHGARLRCWPYWWPRDAAHVGERLTVLAFVRHWVEAGIEPW